MRLISALRPVHFRVGALAMFAASTLLSSGGCGLISKDFEGQVEVVADVDDEDREYYDTFSVNPDENEDVKNNRDKIESGEVTAIYMEIREVRAHNLATFVVGQVDVRSQVSGQAADANWITAVGKWDGIQLVPGNSFKLTVPLETQKQLNDLVFVTGGPIEIRVQGFGDQGPVAFEFKVTLKLRFTATL